MASVRPYVSATLALQARLDLDVLGPEAVVLDPLRVAAAPLLLALGRMEPLVYGPADLVLPQWALYDCAAVPGLICGFAVPVGEMSEALRSALPPAADDEWAPVSRCIAIPTVDQDRWFLFSITGLAEAVAGESERRRATVELALALLGRPRVGGVTQWASSELDLMSALGALRLRSAWSPAHTQPRTLVYELAPGTSLAASEEISAADEALTALQERIEAGATVHVVGPRQRGASGTVVPLAVAAEPPRPRLRPIAVATTAPTLHPENPSLLRLSPFVVAVPESVARFDLAPFGLAIDEVIDPLAVSSAAFLDRLERLDQITFGPEGMPMPRWVYLDGTELTGGIVGMGLRVEDAGAELRKLFGVDADAGGLIPCSVYMAIPTHEDRVWFGHNLASVGGLVPEESLAGLGALTKALALRVFRCHRQVGATQWGSRALFVHTRMGLLELLSAFTPAHGGAETLTYRAEVTTETLEHLARQQGAVLPPTAPSTWLRSDDVAAMQALQDRIEAGERWAIAGRPDLDGEVLRVPLVRLDGTV